MEIRTFRVTYNGAIENEPLRSNPFSDSAETAYLYQNEKTKPASQTQPETSLKTYDVSTPTSHFTTAFYVLICLLSGLFGFVCKQFLGKFIRGGSDTNESSHGSGV